MAWSTESRQSRGYDAAWDKVRAVVLERDKGLCQPCLRAGRVAIGREVDHVVPKAKAERKRWTRAQVDDPTNLQLICTLCHKKKTAEENGRRFIPKPTYGEDGWPIE